ncbi:DNA cytosine methyltransferase [Lacticaseibacillus zeae]|uniref:Cytosine-specific methyltransferase n=1 Tax=Lacticaseibacillus zeae subsp. silagei TaxID=3068307 RepID=A0ABD7ZF49_LACZE|nr:DNA (cytosine-5-)-methyltransferase [Lacticaseibacillus sp. NCIMB 15475]WLV85016.1 DNA (cytosine-5-)-methyltransferase [Lacticaseibacillus sp. NCIMB 15475]
MRSLELFAGIGGIALAEQMAGIEVAGLCEYADYPRMILKKHWPDVPLFKDVTKLDREELTNAGIEPGSIDIVSGGFPCQPFSIAGKRRGTKDDRDLWPEMFRIIKQIWPTWVVGENVANFANMELDRTLSDLESAGYQARAFVLPACAVDAPHQRLRTFIVAHSNRKGQLQSQGTDQDQRRWACNGSEVLADAGGKRWQTSGHDEFGNIANRQSKRQFSTTGGTPAKWQPEPSVGRVADGVPNRMDRLKALGNAVVPQQILPIFKAIVQIEDIKND